MCRSPPIRSHTAPTYVRTCPGLGSRHPHVGVLDWRRAKSAASPRSGGRRTARRQPVRIAGRDAARSARGHILAILTQKLRALVGARVSVVQGPQNVYRSWRPLRSGPRLAATRSVVQFEDLGVWAEKRPEDRPDLGPWLTEEGVASWDVIVWSKMDRAFRSTAHCAAPMRQLHSKSKPPRSEAINAIRGVAPTQRRNVAVIAQSARAVRR